MTTGREQAQAQNWASWLTDNGLIRLFANPVNLTDLEIAAVQLEVEKRLANRELWPTFTRKWNKSSRA